MNRIDQLIIEIRDVKAKKDVLLKELRELRTKSDNVLSEKLDTEHQLTILLNELQEYALGQ